MDSNRGPLVSEATALPTEPQPLPIYQTFLSFFSLVSFKVESSDPDWLVEQFRGNLVVDGVQPFEEDEWKYLHVAGDDAVCFRCEPN